MNGGGGKGVVDVIVYYLFFFLQIEEEVVKLLKLKVQLGFDEGKQKFVFKIFKVNIIVLGSF